MRRLPELDALRGLMLLWMTLTHLPTIASVYVNQPFGFVSAAEGFIFLSALLTGCIYYRVAERRGYSVMKRKLFLRTLRLYGYHALLLALAFVIAVRIAAEGNRPGLANLLSYYFVAGAKHAIVDGALLIYRPSLLDILPMYIIFLLLTPFLLTLAARIGWRFIAPGSFCIWLAAQFGLREAAHVFMTRHLGMTIPLDQMGSFDLCAWQMLWVLGLWCGAQWAKKDFPVETWAESFARPAAIIAPLLLAMRYAVGRGVELGVFEPMFNKWHLGFVRLIDFAAVAALLICFRPILKWLAVRPLVMLGQASLQVFCAHLFFCFFGLAIMGNASMVSGWQQIILLIVTFSALFITAKIFSKIEARAEQGNGAPAPSPLPVTLRSA
jgi:hypothetical protein